MKCQTKIKRTIQKRSLRNKKRNSKRKSIQSGGALHGGIVFFAKNNKKDVIVRLIYVVLVGLFISKHEIKGSEAIIFLDTEGGPNKYEKLFFVKSNEHSNIFDTEQKLKTGSLKFDNNNITIDDNNIKIDRSGFFGTGPKVLTVTPNIVNVIKVIYNMYNTCDVLSNNANSVNDVKLQSELHRIFGIGEKYKDVITPHILVQKLINRLFENPVDKQQINAIIEDINSEKTVNDKIKELQSRLDRLRKNSSSAGGGSRRRRNTNRNNRKGYKKRTKHRRKVRN